MIMRCEANAPIRNQLQAAIKAKWTFGVEAAHSSCKKRLKMDQEIEIVCRKTWKGQCNFWMSFSQGHVNLFLPDCRFVEKGA